MKIYRRSLVSLINSGADACLIASALGCTRQAVYLALRREGLALRCKNPASRVSVVGSGCIMTLEHGRVVCAHCGAPAERVVYNDSIKAYQLLCGIHSA